MHLEIHKSMLSIVTYLQNIRDGRNIFLSVSLELGKILYCAQA